MNQKNKKLAMWGFYLLIGVLLAFAASRTLHFVQTVMSSAIQGYMFLFATGLGALIWLYVYLQYAEGSSQRAISFAMGLVDLAGEMALVYADMKFVGDAAGLVTMTQKETDIFFAVTVVIVSVNIAAGYLFKLSDLNAQNEQHAQDLVDHVTEATLKKLNSPAIKAQMVNELEPVLRSSIEAKVSQEIYARAGANQLIDPRSVGLDIGKDAKQSVTVFPTAVLSKSAPSGSLWMQSITAKDGTRRRAFCLSCLAEGKSWIGGDLCSHFEQSEAVAPTAGLDLPIAPNMSDVKDVGS